METQEQEVTTEQKSAPELTVTDLVNLRAIIDVAVRRGAFGAGEVAGVGAVFDRLNAFVVAVTPQQPAEEKPAAQ
jgi:hypothetical protein